MGVARQRVQVRPTVRRNVTASSTRLARTWTFQTGLALIMLAVALVLLGVVGGPGTVRGGTAVVGMGLALLGVVVALRGSRPKADEPSC